MRKFQNTSTLMPIISYNLVTFSIRLVIVSTIKMVIDQTYHHSHTGFTDDCPGKKMYLGQELF